MSSLTLLTEAAAAPDDCLILGHRNSFVRFFFLALIFDRTNSHGLNRVNVQVSNC